LIDQSCPIEKGSELKNLTVRTISNQADIFPNIDEQLTKGNILGLHYKAQMLYNFKGNAMVGNHASSIVGRRFNPKTMSCEYLLRNSWGKSCGMYDEHYECKDGHVWIAEDYFKYNNSITEAIYVEKNNLAFLFLTFMTIICCKVSAECKSYQTKYILNKKMSYKQSKFVSMNVTNTAPPLPLYVRISLILNVPLIR